ncbi:hypothetical protein F4678DRAFT_465114 [Xylaria arbuscula]|nr:hypothetical protein F4678DRAFT_465114 [Xylaria arbuscula]
MFHAFQLASCRNFTGSAPSENTTVASTTVIDNIATQPQAPASDVWADAYAEFTKREPGLASDYKKHLDTISSADSLNPNWAKSTVEQLQKNREDKQWNLTFHGKSIKFRTQAERLAKVLVWCDYIVKNALSAQPYAALAWSGVSILIPLLTSATAQYEAMLEGFDTINRVQIYWKAYQEQFFNQISSSSDDVIWSGLVQLYSHIFEYQARIICHLSSAQLSRAWQGVAGWNEWEKKASYVEKLSQDCKERAGLVRTKETQLKYEQELEQIEKSRAILQQIYDMLGEERKQQRINHQDQLERNLLADLAADHEGYKNFNPKKVENTCGWFLEDPSFQSWRNSADSSFLWVSAGPGCGKSVLSRSLIDEGQFSTSPATSIVCHYFFKDGDENRQRSAGALSSILHQLFMLDLTGKFMNHALPRHKNYGKALATNFSELWDILLDCVTTPDAGEIVCVLDALDECNEKDRNDITAKLEDFYSGTGQASHRTCRLKFFVTSRPYDTIERSIQRFLNTSCLRIDGDDHSAAVSEDINRVIDHQIPRLLDGLSESNRRRISERLKGKPSKVDGLLDKLPLEHFDAYDKILNQKSSEHTRSLFQLMLAAKRPLSAIEANYALTMAVRESPYKSHAEAKADLWSVDSFESIAKNFCGLLVDFHDGQLSFIHQTVRESLTESPQDDRKWRGSFELPECHRVMSLSCIHHLCSLKSDIHLITNIYPLNSKEDKYPFYRYADHYWNFHYRENDQNTCSNLLKKARDMCHLYDGKTKMCRNMRGNIHFIRKCTGLALAARYGLVSVVRAILDEQGVDEEDAKFSTDDFNVALYEASDEGFPAVVEILLETNASINAQCSSDKKTPMLAAVSAGHLEMIELFLKMRGEQFNITEEVMVEAAGNEQNPKQTIDLLLKIGKQQAEVTEAALAAAAGNSWHGKETMDLLLEQRGEQAIVSEAVMVAAAENKTCGKEIIALIIEVVEKKGAEILVTNAVLKAAAGNNMCGDEIVALLIEIVEKKRGEFLVTDAVFEAAAGNWRRGTEVSALLIEKGCGIRVTDTVLKAAAGNLRCGKAIIALLVEKESEIQVTDAVLGGGVKNGGNGKEIIALLEKEAGFVIFT